MCVLLFLSLKYLLIKNLLADYFYFFLLNPIAQIKTSLLVIKTRR